MNNMLVYTMPDKLLHKQGKLPNDEDYSESGEYYWRLSSQPKQKIDKIYFATEGFIRGYFDVIECDENDVVFDSRSWKDVKLVKQKPFQGFKYIGDVK